MLIEYLIKVFYKIGQMQYCTKRQKLQIRKEGVRTNQGSWENISPHSLKTQKQSKSKNKNKKQLFLRVLQ